MKVMNRIQAASPLQKIGSFYAEEDNNDIRLVLYYDHKEDVLECYCTGSLASRIFRMNGQKPLFSTKDSKEAKLLFRQSVGKVLKYLKSVYGI